MNNNTLRISETFLSIQGEGVSVGYPSVFLRLGGCNLLCQSKSWVCDTIEVWRKSKKTPLHDFIDQYSDAFKNGARLVITGGEPLLHINDIEPLCEKLISLHATLIEVETNGTIQPSNKLLKLVYQWNVSPKLSNSGEPLEKRYKPEVIKILNASNNSQFKFVVKNEEDIIEALDIYGKHIWREKIVIMPAADNIEDLHNVLTTIAPLAIKYNLRLSSRMQIEIWNQTTGK